MYFHLQTRNSAGERRYNDKFSVTKNSHRAEREKTCERKEWLERMGRKYNEIVGKKKMNEKS
jgi:hypothetical protein